MRTKVLIGLSIFFILFANLSYWISRNIYDQGKFTNNIVTAFEKEEVRDALAAGIVDRILADNPALDRIASSPAESAISGVLASPYLRPVVEKVAGRFQNYIVTGQESVSIDLSPVNTLLSGIARVTGSTEEVPEIKNTELEIIPANAFPRLNRWLKPVTTIGPVLGVVGLVLLGYLGYKALDRLAFVRLLGIYLIVGALANMLIIPFTSSLIRQYAPTANAAVIGGETFDTFAASYVSQLAILLIIGLALASIRFFWVRYKRTT